MTERLRRGRDQRAYERFSNAVELPMLVLALLFLPILLAPLLLELSVSVAAGLEAAAWMIWAAFVFEYGAKLFLAPDRRTMVRTHVFDLVIIVLPFLRPLRAARLLRVLHAGSALGRAGVSVRRLLSRRGFSGFLLVVFSTMVLAGLLTWVFERPQQHSQIASPLDGVWWALVTSTTVGYGDRVPLSAEGRGVAVLLMLVGIALLSVVTANIAAFFVEEGDEAAERARAAVDIQALHDRLERMERMLIAAQNPTCDEQRDLLSEETAHGC
jgi:voltage-gated potassium channel